MGVCVSWAETVGRPLQSCWFGEWASSRGGRRAGVAFRALRLVGPRPHCPSPALAPEALPGLGPSPEGPWNQPHFCQQSKSKILIEREPSGGGA